MHSFVLQDWITIRGSSSGQAIIQSSSDYLDLEDFEDAVVWVEIREIGNAGGAVSLILDSAPVKEEIFFTPNNVSPQFATAVGVTVISFVLNNLKPTSTSGVISMPLSRWLRWVVFSSGTTGAWDITFRVLVAAHSYSLASA